VRGLIISTVKKKLPGAYLDRLVQEVLANCKPDRIILFGSWAWGQPGPDSDLDIMIVVPPSTRKPAGIASAISAAVPHEFSLDILVKTTDWVERTLAEGDTFTRDIIEKGVILYEAEHEDVGIKG
jgi:predicted nucleotidyltransferase